MPRGNWNHWRYGAEWSDGKEPLFMFWELTRYGEGQREPCDKYQSVHTINYDRGRAWKHEANPALMGME